MAAYSLVLPCHPLSLLTSSVFFTRGSAFTTGACLMGTLVEEPLKWPPGSCIATSGNS